MGGLGLVCHENFLLCYRGVPRIVLKITGKIESLSLSLRIGECLYGEAPGACPVVWDGTDGCCGDNVTFTLEMGVECSSAFPYLRRATLLPTHISTLLVTEKILGIFPVELADITQIVEDQVSQWVRAYIDPQRKWIHRTHGETLSTIEFLNLLLRINAPAGLTCPRLE